VKKAGTVILAFSVVLWVLTSCPKKTAYDQDYEGRRQAAAEAYVRSVAALAEPMGAKGDEEALARLARAEIEVRSAKQRYYPREAGLKTAETKLLLAGLETSGGGRSPLSVLGNPSRLATLRFFSFRYQVEKIRAESDREVARAGLDPNSPAYRVLQHQRHERFEELKRDDPRAYAAARAYLDEILPAYDAATAPIEHEKAAERLAWSAMGRIGRGIAPVLEPLGFDWRIGTALVGALGAREVFIAQMGIIYAVGSGEEHAEALRQHLRGDYSPLVGFCLMLFILISTPCLPTLAAMRRESGRWGWVLFQLGALTILAYVLTLIAYQAGRLLGLGQ
jgi:ferrous iron transport protein B